jgi:hypothetical protein
VIPLFLFVILFGLSMDYHVFILSRVREAYNRGMSNDDAVAHGLKSTAGVVTSAALVMVAVFGSFAGDHEAARRAQLVPAQAPGLAAGARARAADGPLPGLSEIARYSAPPINHFLGGSSQ